MAPPLFIDSPGDRSLVLNGHSHRVWSVAFSPSDQLLASGSSDATIRLWNTESWASVATLEGHSNFVYSLAFSPDGTTLASGSYDDTIKLWDVGRRAQITSLIGHSRSVDTVAFSPDGIYLASGSADKNIILWDVQSRTVVSTLKGHRGRINSVAFSPDGNTLASGSYDHTIRLWDVSARTSIAVLNGHSQFVNSIAFSPSGEYLASGSHDTTIRLWNVGTRAHIATLEDHTDHVNSVAFSSDGKHLASGSYDNTILLWNVESRSTISTLRGHTENVKCVVFSPDDSRLASASKDQTVRLWRISSEDMGVLDGTTLTSSSMGLTEVTAYYEQDATTPAEMSVPSDNDITGFVTLEGSRPIGYGGFGDLFLGVHTDKGRVALKKPRKLLDEALIRRFLREVDLWCSVSHQYILPCLGLCKIGFDVYVVSPFIENGDLLTCMARGMNLNRSKLIFEVAEALTHLHHRGIIHGDVKAQNILLASDGSALLCDFGLAKAFDTMATSTEAKGAGSVRWMAPELFKDESRSMASDVYSLGITIAEVLSGRAPYHTITESFAVMLHVAFYDGRPPKEPLVSHEGKSYGTLWDTAEKCWVKDPKARPYMAQVLGMLFPLTREMA